MLSCLVMFCTKLVGGLLFSLLNMTYGKYIDQNLCCFIPGRVLDEALSVLRVVDSSLKTNESITQRPHELLQVCLLGNGRQLCLYVM